jgi:hemolysin III
MFLFLVTFLVYLAQPLAYMPDGGGVYAETNTNNIIVEPWNAVSSLFLIVPSLYLLWKLRGSYRRHPFLLFCIPLLALGGLGSTFYHAFRASPIFLYMDVLPALLLTLSVSAYFWYRVLKNGWIVALIVGGSVVLRFWILFTLPSPLSINLSYLVSGIVIFVPTLLLLFATRFKQSQLIILAILLLGISLLFRRLDNEFTDILPMGTHFLWHIFSAAGALFLAEYLYYIDHRRVSLIKN